MVWLLKHLSIKLMQETGIQPKNQNEVRVDYICMGDGDGHLRSHPPSAQTRFA